MFASFRLTRDITLSDLEDGDLELFENGGMSVLNERDAAGRLILFGMPHLKPRNYQVESLVRYFVMTGKMEFRRRL